MARKSHRKKTGGPKSDSDTIVTIPSSLTQASANWKSLQSKIAKPQTDRKHWRKARSKMSAAQANLEPPKGAKLAYNKIAAKNANFANGAIDSASQPSTPAGKNNREDNLPKSSPPKTLKLPKQGMNKLGMFDYTHYGELKTPKTFDITPFTRKTWAISMDCEMVGVGPKNESSLARVSIVNEYGYCLYDTFVKPKVEVTDYRTEFSGIREEDLRDAIPMEQCMKEVSELISGHVLVGHSIHFDLGVLFLRHPKYKIRDTAPYYKKLLKGKTPSLKFLVKKYLNVDIQEGEHNSIQDAQAAMKLYLLNRKKWEDSVKQKYEKYSRRNHGSTEEHSSGKPYSNTNEGTLVHK